MTAVVREDFLGAARPTRLQSSLGLGGGPATVLPGGLDTWTPIVHDRIPVVVNRGQPGEERMYATGISGDTLTGLLRGQDGTTEREHDPNSTVEVGLFASHVDEPNRFLSSPTAAGQVAVSDGADSWGTPTDTLDGIALTDPVIGATQWADAQHTHIDAATAGVLPGGAPTASAVGDTTSTGTAGSYATFDHRHEREDFGSTTASRPGDVLADGDDLTVAHSDHVHSREPYASDSSPLTFAQTGEGGVEQTIARGDHTHTLGAVVQPAGGNVRHSQDGTAAWTLTAAASVSVSVTFAIPYDATPRLLVTPFQGASVRIGWEVTAKSATGFTLLIFRPDGTSTTASGTFDWLAIGDIT